MPLTRHLRWFAGGPGFFARRPGRRLALTTPERFAAIDAVRRGSGVRKWCHAPVGVVAAVADIRADARFHGDIVDVVGDRPGGSGGFHHRRPCRRWYDGPQKYLENRL